LILPAGALAGLFVARCALAIVRTRPVLAELIAHVRRLSAFVDVDTRVSVDELVAGLAGATEARERIVAGVVAAVEDGRGAFIDATAGLVAVVGAVATAIAGGVERYTGFVCAFKLAGCAVGGGRVGGGRTGALVAVVEAVVALVAFV